MLLRISHHDDVILGIKPDLIGAASSARRNRCDRYYIRKWRLGSGEIKYLHGPVRVVGPEMIVRGHHDSVGTHAFDRSAGIASCADSMKTANPAQVQIIFGVEDIHGGISAFRQVVARGCLIHPADIKPQSISRYEDRADELDGGVQIVSGTRAG